MDLAIKTPIRINNGSKLILKCPAQGNPLPRIIWLKNGLPTNIGIFWEFFQIIYILELTNPTSAKYTENVTLNGIYTCRLENQFGSLEADFHVQIVNNDDKEKNKIFLAPFGSVVVADGNLLNVNNEQKQPIIAAQPLNSTVRAGNTANFQCKVQGGKDVPMIRVKNIFFCIKFD